MGGDAHDATERIAAAVRDAHAAGTPLVIEGGGSKRFLGRAGDGDLLPVAEHRGVLSYAPTELTLTARAGTTLAELAATLAEHGQHLPFEPPALGAAATLGGTVACGLSGPRRPYAGALRDFVLGVRIVNGRGQRLRFGGEVMKNVAGYDLSRLMAGAMGTLGVLLDVSLKVLPAPAVERTLAFETGAEEAVQRANEWAGRPLPLSAALHVDGRLLVRLSGTAGGVEHAAATLGGETLDDDDFWPAWREQRHPFFAGDRPLWRLSVPPVTRPIELPGETAVDWGGALRWLRSEAPAGEVRARVARAGGHATLFRGGAADVPPFHPLEKGLAGLHARLKASLDPLRILNRGRMYADLDTDSQAYRAPMQTSLADFIRDSAHGEEAEGILRKCVHCGFCTATCPTYQLLGDELDGPRGRIYLVKQVLEGEPFGDKTRLHLDRCLTCRACETTCPSGVLYGRLVDIGRDVVDEQAPRSAPERIFRHGLRTVLAYRARFAPLLGIGQRLRPLLPGVLAAKVPPRRPAGEWPAPRHERRVLALGGCVQPAITPDTDAAAARVLDRLGLSLLPVAATGCCGAVHQHLSAPNEALDFMRRNIDAWWPEIEAGAEAILINASACALMVKEYGHHLRLDPAYAAKAARVSDMTRDLCELLGAEDLAPLAGGPNARGPVAFHSPCTLQHGQKLPGRVEALLRGAGIELVPVADAHLCCGSAGTYSILQHELSQRLLANKIAALEAGKPALIATANVGCLAHLQTATRLRVVHWVRLLDPVAL